MKKYFFLLTIFFTFGFFTSTNAQEGVSTPPSVGSPCNNASTTEPYVYTCVDNSVVEFLDCGINKEKCKVLEEPIKQAVIECQKLSDLDCEYRCLVKKLDCNTISPYKVCTVAENVCVQECKEKSVRYDACRMTIKPLSDKREECLKETHWLPVSESEKTPFACREGYVCNNPKNGGDCVKISSPSTFAPEPAYKKCENKEYEEKFAACVDACGAAVGLTIKDYDKFKVCMHSCGDIHSECETTPAPSAPGDEENPQQGDELPFITVVLGKNGGVDMSISETIWKDAVGKLEKIKQEEDPRWTEKKNFANDYNAELVLVLDQLSLNQETKDEMEPKVRALRKTAEDMHEIAVKNKDWSEFPETVESIKKGEVAKYGKLDFATDAVKSFNEYHDERAKGRTVADASTKAALDNFGSTALTLIPVFKAIDLVASTPDVVANVFGIDEKNWLREKVTKGFIGKFAPSDVIKQTTDLMAENKWSDIGNTLAYGWDKLKNSHGVYDTLLQTGTLLDASIGAVPVAIARGLSDTIGATIFVGGEAVDLASRLFTY